MKKIHLREILEVKRGIGISSKYCDISGKYIRLTLGNFNYPNNGFKYDTSKNNIFYNKTVHDDYILKKNDIITPLTEQAKGLFGETALIPEDDKFILTGDIGLVTHIEGKSDHNYIYFLLPSYIIKQQLSNSSQQTKIRHTSPRRIMNCIAYVPDLSEQKKIGLFLKNINMLIQTNNKIICELEQLSKTLYNYWFVQYDFPDENGKPYKSSGGKMVWSEELGKEIPEGWEINSLAKYNKFYNGYPFSSKTYLKTGKYKIYTIKNVTDNGINADSCSYLNALPKNMKYECKLQPGDLVLTLTGHVSRVSIVFEKNALLNQRLLKIVSKYPLFMYLVLKDENIVKKIKYSANGSSQKNLSANIFNDTLYAYPDEKLLDFFSKSFGQIYDKMILVYQENQELANLRDFLLPLLMNGQAKIE